MAQVANAVADEGLTYTELGTNTFNSWPDFIASYPDSVVTERFLYLQFIKLISTDVSKSSRISATGLMSLL